MRMLLLGIDADLAGDLDLRLRPKGHELTWCRHSREGVELANADHPIVVVEWPGPEGADVAWLDRIRGQHPDATLLVLSPAAHLAPLADRVKRLGCTFVLKPIALDVLAAQLHEFAEGGTGLRSGQRRCADVDLHPAQRVAFRRGMQVKLTHREWLLLDTLLQRRGTHRAQGRNRSEGGVRFERAGQRRRGAPVQHSPQARARPHRDDSRSGLSHSGVNRMSLKPGSRFRVLGGWWSGGYRDPGQARLETTADPTRCDLSATGSWVWAGNWPGKRPANALQVASSDQEWRCSSLARKPLSTNSARA